MNIGLLQPLVRLLLWRLLLRLVLWSLFFSPGVMPWGFLGVKRKRHYYLIISPGYTEQTTTQHIQRPPPKYGEEPPSSTQSSCFINGWTYESKKIITNPKNEPLQTGFLVGRQYLSAKIICRHFLESITFRFTDWFSEL